MMLTNKNRLFIWCGILLLYTLLTLIFWPSGKWLSLDITSLLPGSNTDPIATAANTHLSAPMEKNIVWLVGASEPNDAVNNAGFIYQQLENSGVFSKVILNRNEQALNPVYKILFDHRYYLLSETDKNIIRESPQTYINKRLESIYNPVSFSHSQDFTLDPLGLFSSYIQNIIPDWITMYDGVPIVEYQDNYYALITSELEQGAYAISDEKEIMSLWHTLKAVADKNDYSITASGIPLFASHSALNAKKEIQIIGGISLISIILILLLIFRSITPLLLALFVIGLGITSGFLTTILIFGNIHLITLAFGSSLIGLSVDYVFHYLCDSFRNNWAPASTLKHILPALQLGILTSVLGFLTLAIAPFPGLKQIAIFTASGLCAAWLTVVLIFPLLSLRDNSQRSEYIFNLMLKAPKAGSNWLIISILLIFCLPGLYALRHTDDIRLFYAADPTILEDSKKIGNILPNIYDSRFYVISAPDPDSLLKQEERLTGRLDSLVRSKKLGSYQALSKINPSHQTQVDNLKLLKNAFLETGIYADFLNSLGFNINDIAGNTASMNSANHLQPLKISDWINSADESWKILWLGNRNSHFHSIIRFSGINDHQALVSLASEYESVMWVDRVGKIIDLMSRYRSVVLILLLLALAAIFIVLALKLTIVTALHIVSIPIIAMLFSMSMLGYIGVPYSVFNLFALLLLLGIGLDYAIFATLADDEGKMTTRLSITLSFITTLLAFGLLSFSGTPVVSAIGKTLVPGLFLTYVLALFLYKHPANRDL